MTPDLTLIAAFAVFLAIGLTALAVLRGWRGWLELRRQQLLNGGGQVGGADLAELKRRVRKLEAIASGTD